MNSTETILKHMVTQQEVGRVMTIKASIVNGVIKIEIVR